MKRVLYWVEVEFKGETLDVINKEAEELLTQFKGWKIFGAKNQVKAEIKGVADSFLLPDE